MEIILAGAEYLEKWAEKQTASIEKAKLDGLKITGFQLRKAIFADLKAGGLGLASRTRYYNFSRDKRFKDKKNSPLAPLAAGLRYRVDKPNSRVDVGFFSDESGVKGSLSKWAIEHAPGYVMQITDRMRESLHLKGIHLRKATTSASVKPRDIAAGGYRVEGAQALQNLKDNIAAKLRGETI